GNVGLGVHPLERHPRAVIEAARRIGLAGKPGRLHQRRDARRELGRAGRRVALLVQFARKAAEIMDRLGTLDGADLRIARVPVRGQREDRARTWKRGGELRPCASLVPFLDRERGRAVREKNRGDLHAFVSTCARPRRSFTNARIASDTRKKTPVSRIASRWLPPVIHVTAPYVSGPRIAARRVATPHS